MKRILKKKKIVIPVLSAVLLLAVLSVLFFTAKITKVTVSGNEAVPDDAVISIAFPDGASRKLFNALKMNGKNPDVNKVFSRMTVRLTGPWSASVTVEEAKPVFQIAGASFTSLFNGYGVRIDGAGEFPKLEGISIRDCALYQRPEIPEAYREAYEVACEIFRILDERNVRADSLTISETEFLLTFGSVNVNLGDRRHMAEKIHEVSAQYGKYTGLKGTLHMENYDGTDAEHGFEFTVEP